MNHWKINFVLLLIISTLTTLTLFVVGTDILSDLRVKESQINRLIDEVGELKANGQLANTHPAAAGTQTLASTTGNQLQDTMLSISQTIVANTAKQNVYLIVGQHSKLTDTIMVGIVDHEKKRITLFSIPRDFAINGRKINEYYEFFGIKKLAEEITEMTNLSIDKYVIVDMKSFKQFIDDIGGVDVYVEKGLTDYSYPTEKKGYQTFSISQGLHHLDGDTALKYARSRHSTSDFDRAKRQQDLIKAVKAELEKKPDLVKLIQSIYDSVKGNVETNVSYLEAIMQFNAIRGYVVSTNHVFTTSDLLYSTHNTGGQYILLPKAKNYSEIQKTIQDWLNQ